jgi:hypothetical protein
MPPEQTDLPAARLPEQNASTAHASILSLGRMLEQDATPGVDLCDLRSLRDIAPGSLLSRLLQGGDVVRCMARVPPPAKNQPDHADWLRQEALLLKLQSLIADTAGRSSRLHIGFPMLSLFSSNGRAAAPIAFIPISMRITGEGVEIRRSADRGIIFNPILATWLQIHGDKPPPSLHETDALSEIQRWMDYLAMSITGLGGEIVLRLPLPLQPLSVDQVCDEQPKIRCSAQLGVFAVAAGDAPASLAPLPELLRDIPSAKRAELAEQLGDVLMSVDPEVLSAWNVAEIDRIQTAQVALSALSPQIAILHAGPLDEELLNRSDDQELSLDLLARQSKLLRRYSQTYRECSGILAAYQARAPQVPLDILAHWATWDVAQQQRHTRRLQTMQTLANTIKTVPLDRSLASRFRREPLTVAHVNHGLMVLQDYLELRRKWLSMLWSSLRRQAGRVTAYFDQRLNPKSAQQIRDFLQGVRLRQDFIADLENELSEDSLGALPSDVELLRIYRHHCMAAAAVTNGQPPTAAAAELPSAAVHRLMPPQDIEAAAILQEWEMPLSASSADRLATFFARVQARLQLIDWWNQVQPGKQRERLPPDAKLQRAVRSHQQTYEFILRIFAEDAWRCLHQPIRLAMRSPTLGWELIQALRRSDGGPVS